MQVARAVQWTRGLSLYFPECLGWMHSHHYALVLHTPGIPGQYQTVPGSPSMCLGIPEYGIGYSDDTRQSRDIPPVPGDTQRDMVERQGEYSGTVWYRPSIPGILAYQDTGYMVEPQGEYPGTVWYRPSIPGILGYQDTGYMVEPQGEYSGTVWYRPSIPGILGYQDTGYMVEPQGEYSGTVWYRPSIPGILGYQDTGYMVETQGGISRDCLVSSEYPGYPSIPRHRVYGGDTGGDIPGLSGIVRVSYTILWDTKTHGGRSRDCLVLSWYPGCM